MLNKVYDLLAIYLLIASSYAANTKQDNSKASGTIGKCPAYPTKQDFDFQKYERKWYAKDVLYDVQLGFLGKCLFIHYQNFNPEDNTFDADSTYLDSFSGQVRTVPGKGTLRDGAVLEVNFYFTYPITSPIFGQNVTQNIKYFVLDTDYETYAIEWHCEDDGILFGGKNKQGLWIHSSAREYLPGAQEKAYAKLTQLGFDVDNLFQVQQKNCPSNA